MTQEEKLTKLKHLADAMYYSMQNLTTDTTKIREAMNNYRQFVINELKESEDENIRKRLIDLIYKFYANTDYITCVEYEQILAWLEKQGDINRRIQEEIEKQTKQQWKAEKQSVNVSGECNDTALEEQLKIWFEKGKCSGIDDVIFHPQKYGLKKVNVIDEGKAEMDYCFTKMMNGEKINPWSEEDERLCSCLIKEQEESLDNVKNDKYGHSEIISDFKEMYNERIDWLQSLKDRVKPQWKPSDAQIKSLSFATQCMYAEEDIKNLESLYNDLRKLKE